MLILALSLILVHSYHSWSVDKKGNHLHASFNHFITSPHPATLTSVIHEAIKSHDKEPKLLCKNIIQIIMNHSLGKLLFAFNLILAYKLQSTLFWADTTSINTWQVQIKDTVLQTNSISSNTDSTNIE